jgi:hypothetical protein
MTIEDLVESLNTGFESNKYKGYKEQGSHFVVQRTITPNKTYKAYKEISTILWYVNRSTRDRNRILTINHSSKTTTDKELAEAIRHTDSVFLSDLFCLIGTDKFEQLMRGCYVDE